MKNLGLLQPLDVPNLKFKSITMDFIVGLPKTQSNLYSIIVVVDKLTKIAHFTSTITTTIAYGVIELFIREIFRHHGIPREIISG